MEHRAEWFTKMNGNQVICDLCPHQCRIPDGKTGICRVRTNRSGQLMADAFGWVSAIHLDPVEKKPLYHYYPGRRVLSVGSVGCNLRCRFCQNYEISQTGVEKSVGLKWISPEETARRAENIEGNLGIAFTYNEPVVVFEYVKQTAEIVHKRGMKNIFVTNGYVNPGPLDELIQYTDAFSVDLKGFRTNFYRDATSSSVEPVLETLKAIRKSGKHLEVVNLLIPGRNDDPTDFKAMLRWISHELGKDTVLHLSAYFPRYKAEEPPTDAKLLSAMKEMADQYLAFVYVGNIQTPDNNTYCPLCGNLMAERQGYETICSGTTSEGNCSKCGHRVFLNY